MRRTDAGKQRTGADSGNYLARVNPIRVLRTATTALWNAFDSIGDRFEFSTRLMSRPLSRS